MDRRENPRPAKKRNRNNFEGISYKTISLILAKDVFDFLYVSTQKEEEKNMSKFIEDNVSENIALVEPIIGRRKYNVCETVKKTFTFSEDFIKKIKSSGNMSLTIEQILIKKFNLQHTTILTHS